MSAKWTPQQLKELKKRWRNNDPDEIQFWVNHRAGPSHTRAAIKKQASRMGLKKTKKYLRSRGRKC